MRRPRNICHEDTRVSKIVGGSIRTQDISALLLSNKRIEITKKEEETML